MKFSLFLNLIVERYNRESNHIYDEIFSLSYLKKPIAKGSKKTNKIKI